MRQAQADYDARRHAARAPATGSCCRTCPPTATTTCSPTPSASTSRARNADDHLAFGIGVHFCLGAHLARMELEAFFRELLPRLEHVELAGEPESMATTFVGGPKRLPIRYRLRPGA